MITAISGIAALGGFIWGLVYLVKAINAPWDAKQEEVERQFMKELAEQQEELTRHANTPVTPSDAARILRERAKSKRSGPPRH